MATNKLQWKRIAKGDRLPCDSLLMKKDGTIPSVVSGAGVKVGQDAYYLPVDDVIEEIRNYPIEESEDEKIRKEIKQFIRSRGMSLAQSKVDSWIAWLEKQGEEKHQYNSRPRYIGEEELLGTNKQGECPFLKQELIDMGFAFTQDGDLAYPIHKIEKKEFAAWSEEDERILNGLISSLARIGANTRTDSTSINYTFSKEIDWLKSLKERVQPQPKQEWGEEDEKMIGNIRRIIEKYAFSQSAVDVNGDLCEKEYIDADYWLKSLRPQTTWKPSEEHYELEEFAKIVRGNLTGISKAVQKLFEAKYLQLTGNKMYGGFKD